MEVGCALHCCQYDNKHCRGSIVRSLITSSALRCSRSIPLATNGRLLHEHCTRRSNCDCWLYSRHHIHSHLTPVRTPRPCTRYAAPASYAHISSTPRWHLDVLTRASAASSSPAQPPPLPLPLPLPLQPSPTSSSLTPAHSSPSHSTAPPSTTASTNTSSQTSLQPSLIPSSFNQPTQRPSMCLE